MKRGKISGVGKVSSGSGLHTSVPPDKGVTRQGPTAPLPNTYAGMMGRRVHAVVSRSSGQPSCERQPQVRVPQWPVGGERNNEQESSHIRSHLIRSLYDSSKIMKVSPLPTRSA
jgi:hypothetical protein